ncbi:MAG: hypothetical protein UY76_C0013G0003 [Candidatus Uhrbacteria bacterium GW2011_GWA2_52_8d]|uniref:Uncharacterized protein n=1 Tax=Candidatus Uhrbacteria bacterium GW2011_GWA2_52_8d TaxID=1618979 RepID=A0A0G1XPW0_9BACT|nr:MAG: hypothetical protein UY76_C0013G0003 [Candidatus Uhrbacteria bacterium GW2011_GWA2_52_8d]
MNFTCSRLHTLATAWKGALDSSEKALQAHTTLFSDGTRQVLEEAQENLALAREAYMRASGEKVQVEDDEQNTQEVVAHEVMVLEHIRATAPGIGFTVESGRVVRLYANEIKIPSDQMNAALRFVSLFESLQELFCAFTNLTELPDPLPPGLQRLFCAFTNLTELPGLLPDTLRLINIQNTPAAKDEKVQKRLDAFKKKNPLATVLY